MDNKIQPLEIYNVTSINNHGNEEKYTSNEKTIAIKVNNRAMNFLLQNFLHTIEITIHQTTREDHPTNRLKIDQ
jgi:hypothetical protein